MNALAKLKTKADQNDPLKCSETEQLAHISPAEFDAVKALAHRLAEEKRAATKEEAALLRHDRMAVDIAMFGRMLADQPTYNVEAACQVAHALALAKPLLRTISLRRWMTYARPLKTPARAT